MTHIRFSDKINPLGLELGERVGFRATCTVDYDGKGKKDVTRVEVQAEQSGMVIGIRKKALGQYVKPAVYDYEGDQTGPYLLVSRYQRFYEIKQLLRGDVKLVLPDDIVLPELINGRRSGGALV